MMTLKKFNRCNSLFFLNECQALEVKKINALYWGRIEDVLMYEQGHEKNKSLINAWDNWVESLEEVLTEKQYALFFSMNHDTLWHQQVNQL